MPRVFSRFLSEGVQWGMGHKQPIPYAQALKLGGVHGYALPPFPPRKFWALEFRFNLLQSETNQLISDGRVRIDKYGKY